MQSRRENFLKRFCSPGQPFDWSCSIALRLHDSRSSAEHSTLLRVIPKLRVCFCSLQLDTRNKFYILNHLPPQLFLKNM